MDRIPCRIVTGSLVRAIVRQVAICAIPLSLVSGLPAGATTLEQVKDHGELVMLCVPHQESIFVRTNTEKGPMALRGGADDFEGFEVEVMRRFADSLGVRLVIRPALGDEGLPSYAAVFPWLDQGEGDIIASSITITDQRRKRADFSRPYHQVHLVVVVRQDSPIRAPGDLEGKHVATLRGSSQEEHILKDLGFPPEQVTYRDFLLENYDAVIEGEVDFTITDSDGAFAFLPESTKLRIAFALPGSSESYGYAVSRGSDLLPVLDTFLEGLEASGELGRLRARYLPQAPAPSAQASVD